MNTVSTFTGLLPLKRAWIWALAVCSIAAIAEGLLAGDQVGQRFRELDLPSFSPPLWLWATIGFLYYCLFLFLLKTLLGSSPTPFLTFSAIVLVCLLLSANAAWSWIFFRMKDLWVSAIFFIPYAVIAIALGGVLWRLRKKLFFLYAFYLVYFCYAAWWAVNLLYLNR